MWKPNSKRPVAQQKIKRYFMKKIGAEVDVSEREQGRRCERNLQHPRQRQHGQEFDRLPLLRLSGGPRGGKQTVGYYENGDQRQQEDGIRLVRFAERRRHLISSRSKRQPANHSDYHAEEHNCGGVVSDDVVDVAGLPGKARHHEIPGDADNQHGEGARRQENEPSKNKNV